jgi:hypothetical protein
MNMKLTRKNGFIRMYILWIMCSILTVFPGCEENTFPVSPLPEEFDMIPPSDVSLLTAVAGDGRVTLNWGAPPERNIAAIYVTNRNDGTEKKLAGDALEAEFTGLNNYVTQNFVVKTENDKGLLSFGAEINAIPYAVDNVKPSPVTNLMGFKLNETSALATWTNPADADLAQILVRMGNESVTVGRENSYAIIQGNVSSGLQVSAVDFSGNVSDVVTAAVNKDMVKIKGSDDGEYETLEMILDPSVVIIDQYRITYGETESIVSVADASFRIPMQALQSLWREPVRVGLISSSVLVTEYSYAHHNDIPGTIRAPFYERAEGSINTEGDMRNIGSIENGTTCWYNVNIKEEGYYGIIAYEARPSGTAQYEIYLDGTLRATGSVGGTDGWSNFQPFEGPNDIYFNEGLHELSIKFLNGGANYEKFLFTKTN